MALQLWRYALCLAVCSVGEGIEVKIGVMSTVIDVPVPGPAVKLAVDDFQLQGHLKNVNFSYVYRNSGCSAKRAVAHAIELVEEEQVDVIIGQKCSIACVPMGYYISHFQLPFYPLACTDPALKDKKIFDTLVRTVPSFDKMGLAFVGTFKFHSWNRFGLFTREDYVCDFGAVGIRDRMREAGITITEWIRAHILVSDDMLREYLNRLRTRSRIMVICHDTDVILRLMLLADDMGMTGGDYVFFYYYLFLPLPFNYKPWNYLPHTSPIRQEIQLKKKRIFTSFKQVTMAALGTDKTAAFAAFTSKQLAGPPWNISPDKLNLTQTSYQIFVYDTTMLYLQLLKEVLTEKKDHRNGSLLLQMARNRTFSGYTGSIILDDGADRHPDFWLWHLAPDDEQFTPYALINMTANAVELITEAYWGTADNSRPPDVPTCGFRDELCEQGLATHVKVLIALAIVSIFVIWTLAFGYIYKKRRLEDELKQMIWKVLYEDIQFVDHRLGSVGFSMRSDLNMQRTAQLSDSVGSGLAWSSTAVQPIPTPLDRNTRVAIYKGTTVSVRRVLRAKLELTRPMLLQLREMMRMNHQNINPFLGACVAPSNICVLMAYCAKGSLQDILENDDIKLDWMFKSSLLSDVINGMCYIHGTALSAHGQLKSSNCLIDDRWIVKITSYGCADFVDEVDDEVGDYERSRELLWTAPELLRTMDKNRPVCGSQRGDVYSFAIILYEVVYRTMPFHSHLHPSVVLEKIERPGEEAPFRPQVDGCAQVKQEVIDLMRDCWAENVDDRPSFSQISSRFKAINKGNKLNIMDNMIQMLEKYALNLENIVEQRTSQLIEEKKRADILLHRMLPRTIADKLKAGEVIEAEMYASVSIYFSDIVGFTKIASESSPIQVVSILNKLYTTFDCIIEKYDVYKVETIGDAYMVVSGLPERNEERHVCEVADMSLALLRGVSRFVISHLPSTAMQLRIGLHTGPCAAGVVGQTMPRYCLFGDTVNMASRMESTGTASKIHISENTHTSLMPFDNYITTKRGQTDIKGKGLLTTYWLDGKKPTLLDL